MSDLNTHPDKLELEAAIYAKRQALHATRTRAEELARSAGPQGAARPEVLTPVALLAVRLELRALGLTIELAALQRQAIDQLSPT